jgi:uncharacterized protein (DUF433 family)
VISTGGAATFADLALYGDRDPRDLPRYSYYEAFRATDVPPTTIAAWFRGQRYARKTDTAFFKPVLQRPDPSDSRLSFLNLLEIHVLRALRTVHSVKLETVRQGMLAARETEDVPHLLLSGQLRTSGGELFLDSYFRLVQLSAARQLAMRDVLKQYLARIHFDTALQRIEFFPLPRIPANQGKEIVLVSPLISFGQPVIARLGITTRAIAERIDASESPSDVIADYRLTEEEFAEAVLYESAAA